MDMMNLIFLLGTTVLTVLLFRVLRLLGGHTKWIRSYAPYWSAAELVVWVALFFWLVQIFFSNKPYYPFLMAFLLSMVAVLLVWFYGKDLVAGFIFRIRHSPQKGQRIQTETVKGTIRDIGVSQLTVEMSDGRRTRIPFSSIVTQPLSLQSHHSLAPGETVLNVRMPESMDPGLFEQRIREALILSSWCVASKPILVQPALAEEGTLRISFFMLDPAYLSLAKERLAKLTAVTRVPGQ